MQVILLGMPGAGKGTQAARIREDFGIAHISTGDMFRAAIAAATPLGLEVKEYLDGGKLVPDDLTIRVVESRLQEPDCSRGFLLDGFPRTLQQAEALDSTLKEMGRQLDVALYIHVPQEVLLARLTGRRICKDCGATYHLVFQPPKQSGVCDACQGELYQRSDDKEETVTTRLKQYAQTAPLVDYYRSSGRLQEVDGQQPIDDVYQRVRQILLKLQG